MNDLKMLKELGTELDPENGGPPPRLRHRVLTSLDSPAPRRTSRWRLSWRWSLAAPAGLAVVIVAALVVSTVNRPSSDGKLTARDVLLRAASFQRADTAPLPRPDQLVYVQSISAYYNTGQTPPVQPKMRQIWMSVDGLHDGLLKESALPGKPRAQNIIANAPLPACINGKAAVVDQQWKMHPDEFEECSLHPAYQDLPTDAAGMLGYLRSTAPREGNDWDILDHAMSLIDEKYATPAQMAAIFEALSHLKSAAVDPDVVDLHGRHGIAVTMTGEKAVWQLVFDPNTYSYFGFQAVAVVDADGLKRGDLISGNAILAKAIVDRPGQLP
ncbi:CU044_5270 family protein [Catelliglobosispora koreensis]|uniref:CU044_5270 family protein n=1 Tax=Catelliglobosispora koreensis TaxID=129052 RepID=UPI00035E680E|nr:CU044_5270 family protein [Catelliglobosispora koreensis]